MFISSNINFKPFSSFTPFSFFLNKKFQDFVRNHRYLHWPYTVKNSQNFLSLNELLSLQHQILKFDGARFHNVFFFVVISFVCFVTAQLWWENERKSVLETDKLATVLSKETQKNTNSQKFLREFLTAEFSRNISKTSVYKKWKQEKTFEEAAKEVQKAAVLQLGAGVLFCKRNFAPDGAVGKPSWNFATPDKKEFFVLLFYFIISLYLVISQKLFPKEKNTGGNSSPVTWFGYFRVLLRL